MREPPIKTFCRTACPIGQSHCWSCNFPFQPCLIQVWENWKKENKSQDDKPIEQNESVLSEGAVDAIAASVLSSVMLEFIRNLKEGKHD